MDQTIKVLALKITPKGSQPENSFYALKIPARILVQMAFVPVRHPIIRKGTQRPTDTRRLLEIARYISQDEAMFPNTIIVNFTGNVEVTSANTFPDLYWLQIPVASETAIIVDGQHRLLGIKQSGLDLEILVTAFLNIREEKQAAIFRDINFYQRKVNKSLMYDLFHVAKDAGYSLMRAADLTERLNQEGPLQGLIKLTGIGPGVVTQTIFVETLQRFLENGGVFREPEYSGENSFETQFHVLSAFFDSLRGHYSHIWNDPKSYILLKTQGVYASLMLFQDVLRNLLEYQNRYVPRARDLEPFVAALAQRITFTSEEYGDAYLGSTGQRRLHQLLQEATRPVFHK